MGFRNFLPRMKNSLDHTRMKKPSDILLQWIDLLNQGQVNEAAAMYAEQATLLPTFSAKMLRTPADILNYFQQLGQKPNLSISQHEATQHVFEHGAGVATLSGIYTFKFDVDGTPLTFEARYTFVVDTTQAAPIMHHHSSQIPRGMV